MDGFFEYCLLGGSGALLFSLAWLLRGAVSLAFADRPLVIALCVGWWTGQWEYALPLGLALELFWLDVLPLGLVTPPVAAFSYLLVFSMQLLFPPSAAGQPIFPLFAGLACANLSAALERHQRCAANAAAARLQAGQGTSSPDAVVRTILLSRVLQQGALYLAAFVMLSCLMRLYVLLPASVQIFLTLPWTNLYGLGLLGAIAALRLRNARLLWIAACLALALGRWLLLLR